MDSVSAKPKVYKKGNHLNYFVSVFLCICIVGAGVFYLIQITSNVTFGFKISEQEQKIYDLKLTNQNLAERLNKIEDLNSVREKALAMGLVDAGEIEYLDISDTGVAMK